MKALKPIFWILLVLLLIFGGTLITLYTDWLWFVSLNYEKVFTKMLWSKIELGLGSGIIFFLIIYMNLWLARKFCPATDDMFADMPFLGRLGMLLKRGVGLVIFLVSIIISVLVGLQATVHWNDFLFFLNPSNFGELDPIFKKDIGFYVFNFPFLKYLYGWLFGSMVFSALLTAGFYYSLSAISFVDGELKVKKTAKNHILSIIAIMFLLRSYGFVLDMYDLLFKTKDNGLFTGASYTAVKAGIPGLWVMIIICVIAAIMTIYNRKVSNWKPVLYAVGIVFLGNIVFTTILPNIVQVLFVKPNELERETPYISYAIKATRNAYALNNIQEREFEAEDTLTADQLNDNQGTVENIRLWDSAQLLDSYSQIQTIQQYYSFKDVDVDRYWLTDKATGQNRYRQVWLSARELDQSQLPDNSKTWVNTRLRYTHGYGYVMSPVNEINKEGMPKFFVYDIPPKTKVDMPINNMGVYIGENTEKEIFVKTTAKEFDYPKGSEVVTNNYNGNDGVKIDNWFKRLFFAIRFADINILLNTNIKNKSQVLFHRNVDERIENLFPFMVFDSDPYLVTSKGELFWILDGFTTSQYYPYSAKTKLNDFDTINYVRNSFKIVVNAHSGEVNAYVIDKPAHDPMMSSYKKIYPGVFKDFSEMPKDLAGHIRYSQTVFKIQTDVFKTYHMTTPSMFYNKSDLWGIPMKANLGGDDTESLQAPYYTIMKLPNAKQEEFILMTTFTRAGRKNMCSWIAARCDGENYGRLLLYNFPKDKNVYGPQQITAKIKQDDVISPQITLWGQQGSNVSTGNLLVIPVENSILYVLPLYLESSTTKIPELKRIIVALGDNIVMEETLAKALSRLVGGDVTDTANARLDAFNASAESKADVNTPDQGLDLAAEANNELKKAKAAQQAGDWAKYGEHLANLENILNKLIKKTN